MQRAWRAAQESGAYSFSTEIEQIAHPGPALANVGRSSKREFLYLDGETNLSDKKLNMRLWTGQAGQGPENAFQIRIEGDRAYGRCASCAWTELEDPVNVLMPGTDMLAYLSGITNVTLQGSETRAGIAFTRYAFEVDGPAFGEYLRGQIEDMLRAKGTLPPGVSLDTTNQYRRMNGEGEIWVDARGLPLRLSMRLELPAGRNGDWVEAIVRSDFSRYAVQPARQLVFWNDPAEWATQHLSGLIRAPSLSQLGYKAGLMLMVLGLALLVAFNGHRRRVYATVVLAMISSMVFLPLLQTQQLVAFSEHQDALRAERDKQQQEREAAQNLLAEMTSSTWDPHRSPYEGRQNDYQQQVTTLPLMADIQRLATRRLLVDGDNAAPDPNSDEDGDGLTYAQETFLGTDPLSADTDVDSITDDVEVQGFDYDGRHWYMDPLNPDSNNDGLLDSQECPECVREAGTKGPSPHGVCQDTDSDGVPDAFDDDNDNDGVPDRADLSPFTRMGSLAIPFSRPNPFKLNIRALSSGATVFVDLQLRPINPQHLSYIYNVLDWPTGDTEGQIQRVNDTTFADQFAKSSPQDSNGDMRLIPM